MNRKKLFTILLVGLVAVAQFTGCTKKESTDAPAQGTQGTQAPLKFTMNRSSNNNQYATSSPDINNDKWVKEINKRANVEMTIKMMDHNKFAEQMQLMFASGDIPDIVWSYGDWKDKRLSGAVEAGVFTPLDDLLAKNKDKLTNLMKAIPEQAWKEAKTDFDGKTYGIPAGYLGVPALNGTFVRKDLLDKYGLKAPTNLDEAVKMLKTFKDNGMKFPYTGREKWNYTTTFLEPFGVATNRWNTNEKGELVPDIIRPEMKEALAFHANLVKEGLMDPEFLTTNGTDWNNKIKSGKAGIFTHQASGLAGWDTGIKDSVPDGKFALIPAIAGPKGAKGSTTSPTIQTSLFINRNFKEADRFLQFLDWASTEEAQEFFAFGIEGQDYTKKDGKIQYTPTTDAAKATENAFRGILGMVGDGSYNKLLTPYQPGGQEVLNYFQNIGPKEGYHAYKTPIINALKDHPDLAPEANDLFFEYAAKIVLGQIPVSDFDKFVAEYMKRGGDKVIKEATEQLKAGKLIKY